jgi:pSer/pThr/pTyr-binding forkhead associated (FHA) protein
MRGARRGEETTIDLASPLELGRAPGCGLSITNDDEVSAHHARLVHEEGRVLLEDLDSTNGTFLNGVAIQIPAPIGDRDVVRIGRTELRLEFL